MASIFDRYGIKEVADVTFYSLEGNGQIGAPALYLDTLKISTAEQTAESTEARGGKGNAPLMTWDYGKEVMVNLEDALFSSKSLEVMYGSSAIDTSSEPIVRGKYIKVKNDVNFFTRADASSDWSFDDSSAKEAGLPWVDYSQSKTGYVDVRLTFKNDAYSGEQTVSFKPKNNELTYISYSILGHGFEETTLGYIDLQYNDNKVQVTAPVIGEQPAFLLVRINFSYYPAENTDYKGLLFKENNKDLIGDSYIVYNGNKLLLNGSDTYTSEQLGIAADDDSTEIGLSGLYLFEMKLNPAQYDNFASKTIEITANTFPGTYYVTADTYVRNEKTGKDEFFQLILPKVKVLSESNTITMEADGDPTVFNMSLKALKDGSKPLMQLISYSESNKSVVKGTIEDTWDSQQQSGSDTYDTTFSVNTGDIPFNATVTITKITHNGSPVKLLTFKDYKAEYNNGVWTLSGSITTSSSWAGDAVTVSYEYSI